MFKFIFYTPTDIFIKIIGDIILEHSFHLFNGRTILIRFFIFTQFYIRWIVFSEISVIIIKICPAFFAFKIMFNDKIAYMGLVLPIFF